MRNYQIILVIVHQNIIKDKLLKQLVYFGINFIYLFLAKINFDFSISELLVLPESENAVFNG